MLVVAANPVEEGLLVSAFGRLRSNLLTKAISPPAEQAPAIDKALVAKHAGHIR